jgi:hypothetical protein
MEMRVPSKISKQLPEDGGIHGDAHRFPGGLARQPGDSRAIQPPPGVFTGEADQKPVELVQRVLGAYVSVPETSLEREEVAQLAGDGALERTGHRGTGSAMPRRRRSAPWTYTEVDEEER